MGKILVTGATGKTGAPLVKQLIEKGELVRAATRNPAAAVLEGDAFETVDFDFERPQTFSPALDGVDRVFLMARPGDPRPQETGVPFIDQAVASGVRLIVNLTAMGVERVDDFPLRLIEKYIEASLVSWTHLRPNWFMQNFNSGPMLADIQATGALHLLSGDAKISFIDVRDVAAVAAVALTECGHTNKAYMLTGGEALDHHQVVSYLSNVAGKTIRYVPLGEDDGRKMLAGIGLSGEQIERMINMQRMVRQGLCQPVSPDVESVLGRTPITFEQYVRDYAGYWK
jgi:uncharacterized protein YbjT (DUF2867 family)